MLIRRQPYSLISVCKKDSAEGQTGTFRLLKIASIRLLTTASNRLLTTGSTKFSKSQCVNKYVGFQPVLISQIRLLTIGSGR